MSQSYQPNPFIIEKSHFVNMGLFDKLFGKEKSFSQKLEEDAQKMHQEARVQEKISKADASQTVFEVQDVYNIMGVRVIPVGKVVSGILKVGQTTQVNGKKAVVKTIEMHHQQLQQAVEGDNVGINLSNVSKEEIKRGDRLVFQ